MFLDVVFHHGLWFYRSDSCFVDLRKEEFTYERGVLTLILRASALAGEGLRPRCEGLLRDHLPRGHGRSVREGGDRSCSSAGRLPGRSRARMLFDELELAGRRL